MPPQAGQPDERWPPSEGPAMQLHKTERVPVIEISAS